ncbi:hypothetical protein OVY29_07540 [Sphingopyxis sp. SE2]|jgi:hypothetical protein|uniref:hypothetical protein n=1 Tax=unclassified Sphingopyxis TaxID=2614943 RepID=UPI00050FE843|nr:MULTISPECIES: hypothetical protein [unclassified Sphingopyxis]KGB51524.1 hypothetical protein FG95_03771 [Sphingopyxis sp. LC363]MDT7528504.1 hypothetical protein [Sphingopyxis sp. SE2]
MNKFTALMGTVAALAMPFAANAQSFSGNANGSSGYADLEQTLRVTCDVTFDGTVTSSTTVAITSPDIAPGDFSCFAVVPQGTWSAATVPGDATKVDITMGANTIANDPCYGTVRGDWNNSTKVLTITNKTLPPIDPNGNTCTIHDASISIPNLNLS